MPVASKDIRDIWRRLIQAVGSTEEAVADKAGPARYVRSAYRPLDATAATVYRIPIDYAIDHAIKIEEAKVCLQANVTADGTNYKTITLVYNDGAAGSDTTIGTVDTSATGFTAKVARALTLTAANQVIPVGSQLEWVVAAAGTGVALTAGSFIVKGYVA